MNVQSSARWSVITLTVLGLALPGCDSPSGRDDGMASGIGTLPPTGGDGGGASDGGTTGTPPIDDPVPPADDGPLDDSTSTSGADGEDTMDVKFDLPVFPDVGGPDNSCQTDPMADADGDGFSVVDGDCNDCDANVNPGAIEVEITEPDDMGMIPEPADEDCDGVVDNIELSCDAALALDDADPFSAAAAIGLCKTSAGEADWGVVDAQYVRSNGAAVNSPVQHGLMTSFGANLDPLEGDSLLVLSSGHARTPGQAQACGTHNCSTSGSSNAPAGFPQDVPACDGLDSIFDDIALEVTLRAPTNATGYAFSFDFYSFEYPEYVCTQWNDQFIALVDPPPPGSINGNISFDAMTNPVSVNIAFFEVCAACPLGTSELVGTGFDEWNDAGATSWLTTTAPVEPGELVTIRFAIWDTGDQNWDSTALIDNFRWIADGGTVMVGTTPEG